MSSVATLVQTAFRVRQDVEVIGNPPVWYATENTAVTLPVETLFRIRFAIQNTGTAAGAGPQILRVSKNSGAYTAVTTTSGATLGAQSDSTASSSADEAAVTTALFRLTAGTGTALAGKYDETGSATLSITNGFYTEIEYGLILKTAGATIGDTFDFRVYNSTTAYTTYTQTARVTCGTNSLVVRHFRIRTDTTAVASNTPTWGAAEDTNYYPGLETTFRLRLTIDNLSATLFSWSTIDLRVSKNGGAYNLVTTSSTDGLQSVDASSTADDASIGSSLYSLTAGTGTVANGRYDETGSIAAAAATIAGNRYVEYEFGLILRTANLTNGDVLSIRPYTGSVAFSSYSVTPAITVVTADTEDDLLANDIGSTSTVSQPGLVAYSGSGPTNSLITSYTPGTPRNNHTGEAGVRIGIGGTDVTVSWVGMLCLSGNTGLRTIRVYAGHGPTVLRTVIIDLTGKTAGTYVWEPIVPLTLTTTNYYALALQTTDSDGNYFADVGPMTMQSVIADIDAIYSFGVGTGFTAAVDAEAFVGIDLGWQADTEDDLLANDITSLSSVTAPALASAAKVASMMHNYRMRRVG